MALLPHQIDEVEALRSIFTDSDIRINGTDVTLLLLPNPGAPIDSEENQVAIGMRVSLLPDYPSTTSPEVFITTKKNIDGVREAAVRAIIEETLSSNAGFEVLFDLHARVTEWLQLNNEPLRSLFDTVAKNQSTAETPGDFEDEESSDDESQSSDDSSAGRLADKDLVPEDHRVTEEQFQKWKTAFRIEMISARIWKDEDLIDSRPTGKQLFLRERGLDASVASPNTAEEVFWKDEALYDDDDVELDDIEE